MITKTANISINKQCKLLGLCRSQYYYKQVQESDYNLKLMKHIDKKHLKQPFLGYRRMTDYLLDKGYSVNKKRIRRLMNKMGVQTIYPKKHTTKRNDSDKIYPYLLRNLEINRPNQVWASDITYIPMAKGFLYLTVIMDWYSRKILSFRLSNTLDTAFCINALEEAIHYYGKPEIFNSDQGSQYTSKEFTKTLTDNDILISMDGKGAWRDNIFVERLWRSIKYEEVYLNAYDSVTEAKYGIKNWIHFYNFERKHQTLKTTPEMMYIGKSKLQLVA